MPRQGLEIVFARNLFYWENYRSLSASIVLLGLLSILLIGFNFYQYATEPAPKYFGTTPDGNPIPIVPLNQPLQSKEFVLNWAKTAVTTIYSMDYINFRKTLQDAEVYFTWKGHADFMKALKVSTNLEALKDKRQVVSAEITGEGGILRAGIFTGQIYQWDLKIPVTFVYQNSSPNVLRQLGTVLLTVQRSSTLRNADGIAISQLVFVAQAQK